MRALLAALIAAASFGALAQTYPTRPVRVVSTFASGSAADISIRLIAQKMTESMGQPVVIDVRAGGGGVVGAEAVKNAAPDGYTLLHAQPSSILTVPFLLKRPPYDALKDFTPITVAVEGPQSVVVNPSVPVHTVKELIEYIRKNPGKLAYGHNGIGGTYHLQMEMLRQQLGLDITHVPYKGGAAALTDCVAGNVPIAFGAAGSALPFVRSGKLRMLAILDAKRYPDLPDVPSMAEDIPGFERLPAGLNFYGPAALPRPITQRVYQEVAKAVRTSEVVAKLKDVAFYPVANTPEEFAAQHRRDLENTAKAVKAAGLQPE